MKKTNQLWGQELNSDKTHKAKYDKKTDTTTFKSDGPGTYVIINKK